MSLKSWSGSRRWACAARSRVFRSMPFFSRSPTQGAGLLALLVVLAMLAPMAALADTSPGQGGMADWPAGTMARALEEYVPAELAGHRLPGASLAVVSGCKLVWQGSYGAVSSLSDDAVAPDTRFRSDGFGAMLTAYAAMSMARDKLLFLDAPLASGAGAPPGLPDALRQLTLRQILWQAPPERLKMLQSVLLQRLGETVTLRLEAEPDLPKDYLSTELGRMAGTPFPVFMQNRLFTPLGMASSGFGGGPAPDARGHAPLSSVVAIFGLPFAFAFSLILGTVALLRQSLYGPGRIAFRHVAMSFGAALLFAVVCTVLSGGGRFLLATAVGGLGYVLSVFLIVAGLDVVVRLLGIAAPRRRRLGAPATPVFGKFIMLALIGCLVAAPLLRLQMPLFTLQQDKSAGAFRTTAPDMARFAIAFMRGDIAGPRMRDRMLAERDPDNGGPLQRGLGVNVMMGSHGPLLWQQDRSEGYSSLIAADPARCAALVVMVNAANGQKFAREMASQVMGPR
ncbi:MAG: serine hydrolase [Parvibaculaceae bacterium]|nr:serine hydrolase [Parvibaculaceae bacterium]